MLECVSWEKFASDSAPILRGFFFGQEPFSPGEERWAAPRWFVPMQSESESLSGISIEWSEAPSGGETSTIAGLRLDYAEPLFLGCQEFTDFSFEFEKLLGVSLNGSLNTEFHPEISLLLHTENSAAHQFKKCVATS